VPDNVRWRRLQG